MFVLKEVYLNYFEYVERKKDLRTDHLFLMGSPVKIIALIAFYLYFVKVLGPNFMKDRKPFNINKLMIIYNLLQILANSLITALGLYLLLSNPDRQMKCILVDYSYTRVGYIEAYTTYAYFIIKVVDLLDTIFFIFRKNFKQASFLHVYHHAGMVLAGYCFTRYAPGGHLGFVGIVNGFVHIIMYGYYFITALNPIIKNSLWWKKYITQIQITQFTFLFIHFLHPLLFGNCKYPKSLLVFGLIQNCFMLILFVDFYYKAYLKKPNNNKQ